MPVKILLVLLISLSIVWAAFYFAHIRQRETPAVLSPPAEPVITVPKGQPEKAEAPRIAVIAENLEIPWSLDFLPDGGLIFTERPGRVRLIDKNGQLLKKPVLIIDEVKHQGEGGLLGLAVHPDFIQNQYVYFYYTYRSDGRDTLNRVVRYQFDGLAFRNKIIIVDEIPGAFNHNGGRIKFGPDKFLYITTGDAQEPSLAQNVRSLAGKILRVTEDGKSAPGNPFSSPVFSYGHRNPQGLTWDSSGWLWSTEHGSIANDELNLVEAGKNYGWPLVRGSQTRPGFVAPVLNSGLSTWAPAGTAYYVGSIFFAGLRGQALYEAVITGPPVLKEHLKEQLGRIRDVVAGPDGFLYITTSNRDGRGAPRGGDDKIIRLNPGKL